MRVAFLVVVLIAPAASSEGVRGSVSGGLGVAHDGLGIQFDGGSGHWTGFVGVGVGTGFLGVGLSRYNAVALGGRWSMRPDGSGFGIALQGLVGKSGGSGGPYLDYHETLTIISATAHWRWRWGFFILDLGAGPALSFDSYRFPTLADAGPDDNRRLVRSVCLGIAKTSPGCYEIFPLDLDLGLGFAF